MNPELDLQFDSGKCLNLHRTIGSGAVQVRTYEISHVIWCPERESGLFFENVNAVQ